MPFGSLVAAARGKGGRVFLPSDLGSSLALWLDASDASTLITDGAAQFTAANSEFLSVADNASLDFTTKMSWAGWVRPDTLAVNRCIVSKWNFLTDGSWALQSDQVDQTALKVYVATTPTDNGAGCNGVTGTGKLAANTWAHVAMVVDGTQTGNAARLKVYVNGTLETLTFGGTVPASLLNSAVAFELGRWQTLDRFWDGRMDSVGLWGRDLSAAEVTALYNAGAGRIYSSLTAAEKVSLVSWYNLNELSGTRLDSAGSNNLTDQNTVTYAAGVASGAASADGDPLSQGSDKSGSARHLAQATAAKRPILKLAIQNGRNVIRFDGSDDFLKATFTLNQPWRMFLVARCNGARVGDDTLYDGVTANSGRLYRSAANDLTLQAGAAAPSKTTTPQSWHVYSALYNGAGSTLSVDGGADTTGDAGSGNAGGLTLGILGDAATLAIALDVAELFIVSPDTSAGQAAAAISYLKSKWGIS